MSGQLHDLDNDSLLVLYISGELANGDKATFERRLANEPALAAELEKLRAAQAFCVDAIGATDASAKMPVGEGVAVRRVSRAIKQWQVDRIIAYSKDSKKKGLPLPWWSYPVAVAAALIVAFLVWSSRQSVTTIAADTPTTLNTGDSEHDTGGAGGDEVASTASPDVEWLANSFGSTTAADTPIVDETLPVPSTAIDDPAGSMFPTREENFQ